MITAAGNITGDSVFNGRTEGQTVELEYARPGPDGTPVPAGRLVPYDLGPVPSWRNLRFPARRFQTMPSRFALSPRIFR